MPSSVLPKSNVFVRNHEIRDASWRAVYDTLKLDSSIHIFGEGAEVKANYDAPYLLEDFSGHIHTMPISEDGNVNFSVGTALLGVKPLVDVISADFLYRCLDAICNTAAKVNFVRPGQEPRTLVIRAEFLTAGPTTGQRPEVLFTHIPGLRVVVPSTPRDAYGLMRSALETTGVTVYFEDRMIEDGQWSLEEDTRLEHVPLGMPLWRLKGDKGSVTVLTYGLMRQRVERLLRERQGDERYRVDLIDLRTLYPINHDWLRFMLSRTGKLLIVEPDVTYGGIGAELAASIQEKSYFPIKIRRLGAPRVTIPHAPALHNRVLPADEEVLDALASLQDS